MNQLSKQSQFKDTITGWQHEQEDENDSIVFLKRGSIHQQTPPSPDSASSNQQVQIKRSTKKAVHVEVKKPTQTFNKAKAEKGYLLQFRDLHPSPKIDLQKPLKDVSPKPLLASNRKTAVLTTQNLSRQVLDASHSLSESRVKTDTQKACRLFTGLEGTRIKRKTRQFRTKLLKPQIEGKIQYTFNSKTQDENECSTEPILQKSNRRYLKFPIFFRQASDPSRSTGFLRHHRKVKTTELAVQPQSHQSSQFADDKILCSSAALVF